ncbi:MAG: alpha-amylase family glycosyl hydrolase [Bacteroidales bacterium]
MNLRYTLTTLLLLCLLTIKAELITTNPSFVTESGTVEITFDATKGNMGMVGATDCYAHIGIITSKSTSNSDWKYVKAEWNENTNDCKLTSLGSNKWKLTLTPNIRSYFNVTDDSEKIYKLAMVFRNSNGSKEGKDVGNGDIFVDVYEPGLNLSIISPKNNAITTADQSLTFSVRTSQKAEIKLYLNSVNTTPINSTTDNSEITHTQKYSSGNYLLIAEAKNSNGTVRDTAYICSRKDNIKETRPQGLQEGITFNNDGSVTFCFYGADKQNAFLLGDFNDFRPNNDYLMKQENAGNIFMPQYYYWITINGIDPNIEYAFQYLVDGTIRVGDAYCEKILDPWNDKWINEKSEVYPNLRSYPSDKAEEILSVFKVNKTQYNWQVTDFKAPKQDELIIYELLLRDFTEEGSLKAAIDKLDYLQSLGINAIELMPIQEFDGNDSWGYNPNFFFATDKAYGTSEDYKRFVDECHKRGIAVILDVVFNHAWGQSPMVKLWWDSNNNRPSSNSPYCNPIAPHPYSVGSDFKHSEPRVRNHFKRVLKYWLEEYNIDGYRFDLSKGFTQVNSGSNIALWNKKDDTRIGYIKEYVDAVKEANPNAYSIMEHFADNDEEDILASYKETMLWRNMHGNFGNVIKGTNSDLSGIRGTNRVGYMESHDEERLMYMAENYGADHLKASLSTRLKQNGALAPFAYLSPGPRMLWQFGEMGYDISIDYNGRTGRKPILWNYLEEPDRKALQETYKKIITLRRDNPDTFNSSVANFNWQVGSSDWSGGKKMVWSHNELSVVVASNFQNSSTTVTLNFPKTGTWYNHLTGESINITNSSTTLPIDAHGLLVLTTQEPTSIESTTKDIVRLYPNPATTTIYIDSKVEVEEATIISLQGAELIKQIGGKTIEISNLATGYYILELRGEGETIRTKFIKQ